MSVYDWLLRAYPRHYRERYAEDMRRTFAQELRTRAARGSGARAAFWTLTAAHALWFGLSERLPKGLTMRSIFVFDVRNAIRSLRSTPVITGVALLSLALGIGANTALFSILNGLVLKPLPVSHPEQLVSIQRGSWTNPIWEAFRSRAPQAFNGAFAWSSTSFDLAATGKRDAVDGAFASGSVFETLGVHAAVGRLLMPSDDVRANMPDGPVVVISHRLWKTRYNGDPSVVGRRIAVNRMPFTIAGVMPAGFNGVDVGRGADVIMPIAGRGILSGKMTVLDQRSNWWLEIIARLPEGRTANDGAVAINAMRASIREESLPHDWTPKMQEGFLSEAFVVASASNGLSDLRGAYKEPLTIILVVVGAVLIIACANIANVLLARATARRHEMSVRVALGASRWRIARQLFAESALLTIGGAVLGLVFAQLGSALLVNQLSTAVSSVTLDLAPDWRVLGFMAAIAGFTTMLFGFAPALGLSRVAPNDALKEQSRSVTGDRAFSLRNALIIAQVSLSLVLIVGAGLFLRTFSSLASTPTGFDTNKLVIANISLTPGAAPAAYAATYSRMIDQVRAVPGVSGASLSLLTPVSGGGWNTLASVEGGPELKGRNAMAWLNAVDSTWFATYGMHIVSGRGIGADDVAGKEPIAVVNETFAKKFGGQQPVVGRMLKHENGPNEYDNRRIVGVVSDAVYRNARSGVYATIFLPVAQNGAAGTSSAMTFSAAGSRAQVSRAVETALASVDSSASFAIRDMADIVGASVARERLIAVLSAFFGGLALLLAAVGLYGVTAYSVNRRRSEIALRMALGATAVGVVRMMLTRVAVLIVAGVAIGIGLSLWAAKYVSTLLFGLQAKDPVTMTGAAIVLICIGILAGWLPARRASRLDPTIVLRE